MPYFANGSEFRARDCVIRLAKLFSSRSSPRRTRTPTPDLRRHLRHLRHLRCTPNEDAQRQTVFAIFLAVPSTTRLDKEIEVVNPQRIRRNLTDPRPSGRGSRPPNSELRHQRRGGAPRRHRSACDQVVRFTKSTDLLSCQLTTIVNPCRSICHSFPYHCGGTL